MPDQSERDRGLGAYAAEIRAFHTFLGGVLLALGAFHLLVLLPFLQIRAALPVVAGALGEAERQMKSVDEAQHAAESAAAALAPFRRALAAGPEQLRRAISDLVARGRAARPNDDPYKATIRVPRETTQPAGTQEEELVPVEEAIRRQIGKQIDALAMALDAAMEPLRSFKNLPGESQQALRTAQETLGREVLSLNEILQEAFSADPNFWQKWDHPGATFGAASPRAEEAVRRIEETFRTLTRQLAAASVTARNRQHELRGRIETLRGRQHDLSDRLARIIASMARVPLGLEELARLYPIVAGAVALTVLFRLRRLVLMRRALGGVDLDLVAPSWVVGSSQSPGRWWALILIAAPLVATIHASVAALADRSLYVNVMGDWSQPMMIAYGATYAVLIVLGLVQLLAVTRGLIAAPRKRT